MYSWMPHRTYSRLERRSDLPRGLSRSTHTGCYLGKSPFLLLIDDSGIGSQVA
jgi:hypothetical protein